MKIESKTPHSLTLVMFKPANQVIVRRDDSCESVSIHFQDVEDKLVRQLNIQAFINAAGEPQIRIVENQRV